MASRAGQQSGRHNTHLPHTAQRNGYRYKVLLQFACEEATLHRTGLANGAAAKISKNKVLFVEKFVFCRNIQSVT